MVRFVPPQTPQPSIAVPWSSKPLFRYASIVAQRVPSVTFTSSLYFQTLGVTRYPLVSEPAALVNTTRIGAMLLAMKLPVRGPTSNPPGSEASMPKSWATSLAKSARVRPCSSCRPGRSAVARRWMPFGRTFSRRNWSTPLPVPGTTVSTRMLRGRPMTLKFV